MIYYKTGRSALVKNVGKELDIERSSFRESTVNSLLEGFKPVGKSIRVSCKVMSVDAFPGLSR